MPLRASFNFKKESYINIVKIMKYNVMILFRNFWILQRHSETIVKEIQINFKNVKPLHDL